MKKALSFLLAVVMLVGMIPMSMIPAFAAELPTVEIGTGDELIAFMNHVNNGDYDNCVNAILTADIDISMTEGLSDFDGVGYDDGFGYFNLTTPIGRDEDHPFKGTFDGNGHYINYFYDCDVEESLVHSLFGVNEGTIKNLTVGIPGDPDNTGWFYFIGGRECHTAGVCGVNKGTIDGCVNYLDVQGINIVGGIAAYNEGTVINCLNYNRVMGSSDNSFVGGMVGKQDGGRVYNCANYGEVLVDYYTGTSAGIVGCSNGGEVSACFVGGTVSGHDPHTVVGKNNGATVTENHYEIKDGLPVDDNAGGIEKALIDSGYAVSLLREAAKNIAGAKTWFIGADGYPAFVGSDVPSFLTETVYYTAENGIVTVGGTGVIPANAFENDNTIKEAVLGEGITSVGANAFAGCENLHTITVKGQSITMEAGALSGITGAEAFTVENADGTKTDTVENAITNALSGNIKAVYIHRFDRTRDVVTAPACTAEGYTTHYCRDCDYSYTDTTVMHTGHYFDSEGICTKCSEEYHPDHNIVPGEMYDEYINFPGAKKVIIQVYYDEEAYHSNTIYYSNGKGAESKKHLPSYSSTEYPFCTLSVKGGTVHARLESEVFEKKHIVYIPLFDNCCKSTNPTCTSSGYNEYTYCGLSYSETGSKALGHVFNQKRQKDTVVESSCTEEGTITHYCDRCDYSYSDSIPATGHYFDKNGKCTKCSIDFSSMEYGLNDTIHFDGAEEVYLVITGNYSANYSYGGNVIRGNAYSQTFALQGANKTVFKVDGDWINYSLRSEVTYTILAIPNYGNNLVVVEPSCTKEGYTEISYCGETCRTGIVPATGHYFDKNGKCTECGALFSLADYSKGSAGYDKTLVFSGADSITVQFGLINCDEYLHVYDGNGNEVAVTSRAWNNLTNSAVTVPGDTVRIAYPEGNYYFEIESITPNYPAEETPTTPEPTPTQAAPTEEAPTESAPENENTASVLSEGNLWIILVVAVLAIGTVAALVIVKKKKKPAAAGVAADEE